jgi:hypothetical protein
MRLTDNFTTQEVTRSETAQRLGIDNSLSIEMLDNAYCFAKAVLQPLREHIGRPFIISSWYRSKALNEAVGGTHNSAHLKAQAVDFVIGGLSARQTYEIVLETLKTLHIPFDQLIFESFTKDGKTTEWVHLSWEREGNRFENFEL